MSHWLADEDVIYGALMPVFEFDVCLALLAIVHNSTLYLKVAEGIRGYYLMFKAP